RCCRCLCDVHRQSQTRATRRHMCTLPRGTSPTPHAAQGCSALCPPAALAARRPSFCDLRSCRRRGIAQTTAAQLHNCAAVGGRGRSWGSGKVRVRGAELTHSQLRACPARCSPPPVAYRLLLVGGWRTDDPISLNSRCWWRDGWRNQQDTSAHCWRVMLRALLLALRHVPLASHIWISAQRQ
ncbi:hypothetical protein BC831DRAFT_479386, partial [Entophlyctis helioformis]